MALHKIICCLDQEHMHIFDLSAKFGSLNQFLAYSWQLAKFYKEIPFLQNRLTQWYDTVSEWNFDPTSLKILLIMAMSESASVYLRMA